MNLFIIHSVALFDICHGINVGAYLVLMVELWNRMRISASNSNTASGLMLLESITIPLRSEARLVRLRAKVAVCPADVHGTCKRRLDNNNVH